MTEQDAARVRPSLLRAHAEVVGVRLHEAAQYRSAALAGVFTQLVFGFIIFMTLDAFSVEHPERSPMTRPQLVSYVWLGQAFLALLPWTLDRDVVQMVRTGTIAYEWRHEIAAVVNALVGAGLAIELVRETDKLPWPRWATMERTEDGWFRLPSSAPRIPLLYALRARLPTSS